MNKEHYQHVNILPKDLTTKCKGENAKSIRGKFQFLVEFSTTSHNIQFNGQNGIHVQCSDIMFVYVTHFLYILWSMYSMYKYEINSYR